MDESPSKAPLMISVSGVRGYANESLTAQVALDFGRAFAHFLHAGKPAVAPPAERLKVVIGRDSRPSGRMVFGALSAGLMAAGIDVADVGIATTPSVALMGRYLNAAAAIVITASHNPLPWNGIKFLRHDGIAFPPAQAAEIKRIYFARPWEKSPTRADALGAYVEDSRVHAHHMQTVLALFDVRGIAEKRFRVVLDSVNGAGCVGTPMLLSKLGAELIHINGEATGNFAHTPEPTKENLTDLCAKVKEKRTAVGFAQDPDADRLAIVDENGTYIGEEYTLALCTLARMLVKPVPVVANLSTSRMVDDIAARFGQQVFRTSVGEANVAGKMQEIARGSGVPPMNSADGTGDKQAHVSGAAQAFAKGSSTGETGSRSQNPSALEHRRDADATGTAAAAGSVIGGEGNGGIIDLRIGPVRDSFLGIAMILDLMTRTKKSLSQLVAEIPRYAMIKTKFECTPDQSAALVARVQKQFAAQNIDTQDGVRIDWPGGPEGGWVHVRQSNTEPIARIIAEAKDEATARGLIAQVERLK